MFDSGLKLLDGCRTWGHLTRNTVKDPSFIPRASWEPSLLKETLRTDSSMLQRASRVWSGRLQSLRDTQVKHRPVMNSGNKKSGDRDAGVGGQTDLTERSSLPVTATGCLGCKASAHSSPSLWPCISRTGLSRSLTITSKISLSWVPARIRSAFQQTLRIDRPGKKTYTHTWHQGLNLNTPHKAIGSDMKPCRRSAGRSELRPLYPCSASLRSILVIGLKSTSHSLMQPSLPPVANPSSQACMLKIPAYTTKTHAYHETCSWICSPGNNTVATTHTLQLWCDLNVTD